ncbi:YheC/YheD family endospore coat-associated protein [Brevibacillus migulae]|uniref:YheC/YheD family endospore coat-associated protein n=1 Tax=Brevibacillus migulae TaxID=1644114 RepID=UPI00106E76BA|nr:YheC/YheD family protein [Brevibacillus migulae]
MKRIGIMLDWALMENGIAGKPTYERLDYYVDIGKELGLEPVFFHPRHVNLKARRVRGHFWHNDRLTAQTVPIPEVIHNRVLSGQPSTRAIIRHLSGRYKVFNEIVMRDKLRVHQLLWKNKWIRSYLPKTQLYTRQSFLQFLNTSPVLYVKPSIGSVGVGVVRIERQGDRYLSISSTQKKLLGRRALIQEIGKWVGKRRFVVQEGVPLATYRGETFDMRVSVQRNGIGEWCISGMVAKVANNENKLSNLAQGGQALKIDQVLQELFSMETAEIVKMRLGVAALEIAKQYAAHFPSLADLGMDMGIDEKGNPYLIEVNVRDQRYSFFEAGEIDMFRRAYLHPMEYGKSLFQMKRNRKKQI